MYILIDFEWPPKVRFVKSVVIIAYTMPKVRPRVRNQSFPLRMWTTAKQEVELSKLVIS